MKEREIINGVETAKSLYPDGCSCGISYQEGEYKKHLIDFHVIDVQYRYNKFD